MMHEYFISLFTIILIEIIVLTSFNLAFGFTGLINLGHIVFFGIGAYTSAILTLHGVPWYAAIFAAGIIASFFGIIIAAVTARLKGDYLAIVTLGLVLIAIAVSRNWISLTRGALGLPGIPDILKNNFHYMLFTLVISALCVFILYKIVNSDIGRVFQAIRDDETAAMVLGKNTYLSKILSIAISTFFAGIAGSLYAHFINFVDPSVFDLEFLIFIVMTLIVGGLASIKGPIIAVFMLEAIYESLRFVAFNPEIIGAVRNMLYVVILIIFLIYRPRGLFGKVDV